MSRVLEYGPVDSRASSFGLTFSPLHTSRRAHYPHAVLRSMNDSQLPADAVSPRPARPLPSLFIHLIVAWHSLPFSLSFTYLSLFLFSFLSSLFPSYTHARTSLPPSPSFCSAETPVLHMHTSFVHVAIAQTFNRCISMRQQTNSR